MPLPIYYRHEHGNNPQQQRPCTQRARRKTNHAPRYCEKSRRVLNFFHEFFLYALDTVDFVSLEFP
jgi:hypothetical protein